VSEPSSVAARVSGRPWAGGCWSSARVDLTDPTTAAFLAADALEKAGVRHALYGALLLAAYGEPRETGDVDIAVVDAGASGGGPGSPGCRPSPGISSGSKSTG